MPWLSIQDDLFPQLLSFELDTSTSDDLRDPLSDNTADTDGTLVLLDCCIVLHCSTLSKVYVDLYSASS